MRTGDLRVNGKEIITLIVKTSRKYLSLTFPDVQQQQGGSDCLTFSFSLCSGTDPVKLSRHTVVCRAAQEAGAPHP